MKYLLVFLVLAIAIGIWRNKRRRFEVSQHQARSNSRQPPALTQDMVECAQCGVHLPRSEALSQQTRFYCCAEHREQAMRSPAQH